MLDCCPHHLLGGTRKRCKNWDLVNPIFAEKDGGDSTLHTGSTVQGMNMTLAALLGNKYAASNKKDNEDDNEVMLNTLRTPGDIGGLPNTPTPLNSAANHISSANPSICKIGSGK